MDNKKYWTIFNKKIDKIIWVICLIFILSFWYFILLLAIVWLTRSDLFELVLSGPIFIIICYFNLKWTALLLNQTWKIEINMQNKKKFFYISIILFCIIYLLILMWIIHSQFHY